jgi:GNAT superfamily N-acetyltransferase
MIAAEHQVTIHPVPVAAIFDAPNSIGLLQAYAAECLVPDAEPRRPMYEAMEQSGVLQCFVAYFGSDNLLIGFVSVMPVIVPHDGHLIATTESLFVDPAYRHTSAFEDLFAAAEQYATAAGCRVLTCSARIGSQLDKVLARRAGFSRTHSQHTKWLGDWRAKA